MKDHQDAAAPRWTAAQARWTRHHPRVDDAVVVTVGVLSAGTLALASFRDGPTAGTWWRVGLTLAVSACLWWRRARPLLLTIVVAVAVGAGAALSLLSVALLTLAVRRRGTALALGVVVCEIAYVVSTPPGGSDRSALARVEGLLLASALVVGVPVAAGAYVAARRALVASLRERVERAEAEQALRADRTRLAERARIAREMHDVLGHRISLVSLHAGALEVNPAVPAEDVERSAALIRTTAHQAMEELRAVLGVLRGSAPDESADLAPALLQPTLADLPALVLELDGAGTAVTLDDQVARGSEPPPVVGRTVYRVVQEALTNVARHAPDAAVRVRVAGAPGADVQVEVSNERAPGSALSPVAPGSRLGLVGLRERVELAGGHLEAGPDPDGGFLVRARLPWRHDQPRELDRVRRTDNAGARPRDEPAAAGRASSR